MQNVNKLIGLRAVAVILAMIICGLVYLEYKQIITYEELVQIIVIDIAISIVLVSFVNLICQALRRIIRKQIVDTYEQALRDGNKISQMQLATVESLYQSYNRLKGNYFIEDTMKKIRALDSYGEVIERS